MGSYLLLIIVIAAASWWVGNTLKKKFKHYSKINLRNGLT